MGSKADFRVNDRVTATNGTRYPGNGVVVKINPKTIRVALDAGGEVNFDPFYLVKEGSLPNELEAAVAALGPQVQVMALPHLPGAAVRATPQAVTREPKLVGLWLVIGDTRDGRNRITRLNGDGSFWRVPPQDLVKVNATLTEVQSR